MSRLLLEIFAAAVLLLACEPEPSFAPSSPFETRGGARVPLRWGDPGDPSCGFPVEADAAKIDAAEVVLRVFVRRDGSPQAVQTLEEPGFGFGQAATRCAMARSYVPGTDAQGTPVTAWTPPIHLRFIR